MVSSAKNKLRADLCFPAAPSAGCSAPASLSFLPTDPSGFIFDVQSNTVMAQGGTFENMKEKVNASSEPPARCVLQESQ